MKFLWIVFITFTLSSADEIHRVDDILKDINKLRANYKESQVKIAALEATIQKQKELLVKKTEVKERVVKETVVKKQIVFNKCEEPNPFPKLKMKEDDKVHLFTASTYRVNKLAPIYDDIQGDVVTQWEKNTSFTSNKKTSSMIKITGYFIDKKWTPSSKNMWIKVEDVTKR